MCDSQKTNFYPFISYYTSKPNQKWFENSISYLANTLNSTSSASVMSLFSSSFVTWLLRLDKVLPTSSFSWINKNIIHNQLFYFEKTDSLLYSLFLHSKSINKRESVLGFGFLLITHRISIFGLKELSESKRYVIVHI